MNKFQNSNIKNKKVLVSSLTLAALGMFCLSTPKIVKADEVLTNQPEMQTNNQINQVSQRNQSEAQIGKDDSTKPTENSSEKPTDNPSSTNGNQENSNQASNGQANTIEQGTWGEGGAQWSYDKDKAILIIKGGNIKDEDKDKGAFAENEILKNVQEIEVQGRLTLTGNFKELFKCDATRLGNLTEIRGLDKVDTSNVTNMQGMFSGTKIKKLDLSSWDTSKVKDISSMFANAFVGTDNTTLNIGGNFAKNAKLVTDMSSMFAGCGLSKIEGISDLITDSVTNMESMFAAAINLTELDVSHFKTEKVENMTAMFSGLNKIDYLNLSSFDTSNVLNMKDMFKDSICVKGHDAVNNKDVVFPGLTTIVLGAKTKLTPKANLGEPDLTKLENKDDFQAKWQITGGRVLYSSAELLANSYAGKLAAGTYSWRKQKIESEPDYREKGGNVTAHYQDEDGNKIADDEIYSGFVGDGYISQEKVIDGYTIKEVRGNRVGFFSPNGQTVTFIYSKDNVTKPSDNNNLDDNEPEKTPTKPEKPNKENNKNEKNNHRKNESSKLNNQNMPNGQVVNNTSAHTTNNSASLPQTSSDQKYQVGVLLAGVTLILASLAGAVGIRKKQK